MQTTASFTADTTALQRAVESHRPVANRLFIDPYADG
jgi:O-methyltransferase involved in polyketide biosynthesis